MTALNATQDGAKAGPGALPAWLWGDALAGLFIAAVVLATRAVWYGDPVADFDEQLYSFIGWRMQFGELPYVDWWDRKPFGLFAIFGLAHLLLGPGPIAYQLLATASVGLSAFLIYRLSRRLVDRFAATMATSIAVLLIAAYASYSGQSEAFFAPIMLGMAALLVDPAHPNFTRRAAFAMLLGGLALQVKYTVVVQCAFFGVYALWVEYRRRPELARIVRLGALFAFLGLMPTLLVAAFYAAVGEFDAFMFANFLSFFDRAPAPQGRWSDGYALGVSPLATLVVFGTYAAFRMRPPQPRSTWLFYCGWCAATLAGVMLPGTVYLYYFAALAAPAVLVALPILDRHSAMRGMPGVLLLAALFALLSLPDRIATSQAERAAADTLAAAVQPHVGQREDCLWLWDGPTALYRLSHSCVPTRFVYPDHLNNALETGALGVDQTAEVARVLATRPGAIVTASTPMTYQNEAATALVMAALERDYEVIQQVEMHNRTLTAWARRD